MKENFPTYVITALEMLEKNNFESFLVGGCVRDLLLKKTPKDWDITTNALPEEIQKIFPNSFYENDFGTVGVIIEKQILEITTYRVDGEYIDNRHPKKISFTRRLEEDLERRDFSINAIAMNKDGKIFDPFNGQIDLKNKIIRTIGNPDDRFSEDALRLLRAVRFAVSLDFKIDEKVRISILRNAPKLGSISAERIRDEFSKILISNFPANGIYLLDELNLLSYIIPELLFCKGVKQNLHHIYDVWQHLINSLKFCPSRKLELRMASLLHDIGKPQTKKGKGINASFHAHEFVGAKMTKQILKRLKFPKKFIDYVVHLVQNHMFFYEETVTDSAVRRILKRIGVENLQDFIDLRVADRLGSGLREAKSWRLKEFETRAFKVRHHPISTHDLAIKGDEIMKVLKIKPSKEVGKILEHFLNLIIENPERNTKEFLMKELEKWKNGNPTKLEIPEDEIEKKRENLLVQDF
ncbi:MAG: HD domain-containing protein [Patescibacteria group bacterium]